MVKFVVIIFIPFELPEPFHMLANIWPYIFLLRVFRLAICIWFRCCHLNWVRTSHNLKDRKVCYAWFASLWNSWNEWHLDYCPCHLFEHLLSLFLVLDLFFKHPLFKKRPNSFYQVSNWTHQPNSCTLFEKRGKAKLQSLSKTPNNVYIQSRHLWFIHWRLVRLSCQYFLTAGL